MPVTSWAGALLASASAAAQTPEPLDDRIVVYGRGIDLIGEAGAASEGVVGYADFSDRPLSRPGELVEVIPGVVATQHSGEGKANQYFLRGFNLDHGTDFSVDVDGVPVNLRTHGHGQGYLDLNFLIPELVELVRYRKGPYFVNTGDFSSAGSANYQTYDVLPANFVEATYGEYGFFRAVGAGSMAYAGGSILAAGELTRYDGPWVLDQDLEKVNGLLKYSRTGELGAFSITATGYHSEWVSTDQIPRRAVESGRIDRFGFIDDDLGGSTTRYSLSAEGFVRTPRGGETRFSTYAVDYDFRLYSNFTYFLDDPILGDEFEQNDRRTYYGGRVEHEQPILPWFGILAGGSFRIDDIDQVGLYETASRRRTDTIRDDSVEERSGALWAEGQFAFLEDRVRIGVGGRFSAYDAEVEANLPVNSGEADDTLLQPTARLAARPFRFLELYANYGQGFHSNDVRGSTIVIDPATGERADRVPLLVASEGSEVGARLNIGEFDATLALFKLSLDSELVFVGDAGTTEPNDASERTGGEFAAFWRPRPWLILNGSYAYTEASFDIDDPADEIPGAVDTVASGGVTLRLDPVILALQVRHFGDAPLNEDGSVQSDPTTIANLGATYDIGRLSFGLDLLNITDAEDPDISYFYESRLRGEDTGVEDVHFHPSEPRMLRGRVRLRF